MKHVFESRFSLKGRVAVITGAGSAGTGWGNGKAISVLLAHHGAAIVAVDREKDRASETVREISLIGGRAIALAADVTTTAGAEEIARAADQFGGARILVNNVGGSSPGDAVSMDPASWDHQLLLNLTSAYLVTRAVLPQLLATGSGTVVNIGSIAATRYLGRDNIAYAAAKAGLVEYTRQTALRFAREGLRCNTVVPGLLETPLVIGRLANQYAGGDADALIAARKAQIPMGKAGDAWDVAYAVLYLVSDASSHVTATELLVDGGLAAATIPSQPLTAS